jgi:hypothetical protein
VSDSSIEVGIAAVISEETPLSQRAAAMSGWNAITGVRGLIAPFIASTLVQAGVLPLSGQSIDWPRSCRRRLIPRSPESFSEPDRPAAKSESSSWS